MPKRTVPVRFELSVNDTRIATGGVNHVATTIFIKRLARDPEPYRENIRPDAAKDLKEQLSITFGGLQTGRRERDINWVPLLPFKVGDEITIRILGPGISDEPPSFREFIQRLGARNETRNHEEGLAEAEEQYYSCFDGVIETFTLPPDDIHSNTAVLARAFIDLVNALEADAKRHGSTKADAHQRRVQLLYKGVPQTISTFDACRMQRHLRSLGLREDETASRLLVPIRFQVLVNDREIATGGVKHAFMSIIVHRISRRACDICPSQKRDPEFNREEWLREAITIHMGGLDTVSGQDQYCTWINGLPIHIGDTVTVRVLGPGLADVPIEYRPGPGYDSAPPLTASANEQERAVGKASEAYLDRFHDVISNVTAPDPVFRQRIDRLMQAGQDYIAALAEAAKHEGPNRQTYEDRTHYLPGALPAMIAVLEDFRAWKLRNSTARE